MNPIRRHSTAKGVNTCSDLRIDNRLSTKTGDVRAILLEGSLVTWKSPNILVEGTIRWEESQESP